MNIIEQSIVPKNPKKKSEDGIVVTDNFIAVIDGSTSKSDHKYSIFRSNGRYAMELLARYIKKMDKATSCHQFCIGATKAIRKKYSDSLMPHLKLHPEDRMAASAIVYSRLRREIWMIGDCQCLVSGEYYDNVKPYEQELAEERAAFIHQSKLPKESFLIDDIARESIIPKMLQAMQMQNKTYAVADGFPIPEQHVRIITLNFQPWEIVFASDGYPFLAPTLALSEEKLKWQKDNDPLNIGTFKATKAFAQGNQSFDDRAYIRFNV